MKYFKVKNLEKFQHYKNRNPIWIKLYADILQGYEFTHLPDKAKAHIMMIWILASRYENTIPWDEKWIQHQISASDPIDLGQLEKAGFIELLSEC